MPEKLIALLEIFCFCDVNSAKLQNLQSYQIAENRVAMSVEHFHGRNFPGSIPNQQRFHHAVAIDEFSQWPRHVDHHSTYGDFISFVQILWLQILLTSIATKGWRENIPTWLFGHEVLGVGGILHIHHGQFCNEHEAHILRKGWHS